ncbi:hypothetical protein M1146_06545 [Patescibacteria group bacterium]|nr:hypothetical protein [Patescibacteria group bacterium]
MPLHLFLQLSYQSLDTSAALALPGVHAIYTAKDVKGSNALGDIIQDELLFATDEVTAIYQPLGVIVAG